jgi:histidinol-phosphate aminotransferase
MAKKEIIYFDRNENHYGSAPACFKSLTKPNFKKMSNYSRDCSRGVKSKLSERLANDLQIEESRILLGYGGEDILKQAVHCYVSKGDKILIPTYSWWYYKAIADEVGGIKIEYPIEIQQDTFVYNVEEMIRIFENEKPKLALISSPNNPTGNAISKDDLIRFLDASKDITVVIDEAYTLFADPDTSYLHDLVNAYPNLLIIRTFSKYYALAGVRVGYALMGTNHARFNRFSARYLGYNRISERIAIAALDSPEYYEEMRQSMLTDLDMFFNEFNQLKGFRAFRSLANFILVEIPEEIKVPMKNYLVERGLIVKFMDEDNLTHHIRVSLGTPEENRLLMQTIKEFVASRV